MFFNGINILPAAFLAAVAGAVLVASHFLFSRWKSVVVPTVLFWHQDQNQNRRDILWGKFSSLQTLLLLLLIALLMVLALMKPGLGRQSISTIVLDVSPVTDIDKAKSIAQKIVNSSDKCNLIIAGKDYSVKTNDNDSVLAALVSIEELQNEMIDLSSINQAAKEAENVDDSANIYVITGQNIDVNNGIELICLPKKAQLQETVIDVWVPENISGIADRYFAVDSRYRLASSLDTAGIILSEDDIHSLPDWRSSLFVQSFRNILDDKAGIANRVSISKSEITNAESFSYPDKSSFLSGLYFGIFLLLAFNLYMHKIGRIQ